MNVLEPETPQPARDTASADGGAVDATVAGARPSLWTVLGVGTDWVHRLWRPPVHIALLRELCVLRRSWLTEREFEDAIAACNVLPGPASTQLAIFCA